MLSLRSNLQTSKQRQPHTNSTRAHGDLTMAAAGQAFGLARSAPGIISPYRMHEMRTIATDDPVAWSRRGVSVCRPVRSAH